MDENDLVEQIVDHWHERWEDGEDVPIDEVFRRFPCPDHLRERVANAINAVKVIDDPNLDGALMDLVGRPEEPATPVTTSTAYTHVRPRARGGLGVICDTKDPELRRTLVVKSMRPRCRADVASRARFVREAGITARLQHPGIVPVYGVGHDANGHPCYTMKLVEGNTLRSAIRQLHEPGQSLGRQKANSRQLQKVLERFMSVCSTVAFAHSKGVLHRDLKPANIVLGEYDETVVIDWGIAKEIGPEEPAQEGVAAGGLEAEGVPSVQGDGDANQSSVGTWGYMSPEQIRCHSNIGPTSDVYSLGAILYEILTGKPPLADESDTTKRERTLSGDIPPPRRISPNVPKRLQAICAKAMAINPDDRYPSAKHLSEDINNWVAGASISAYKDNWLELAWRWCARRPAVAGLGLLLCVVTSVATVVSTYYAIEAGRQAAIAKTNFDYAKDAVDKYFTGVSEEELLKTPGMENLRKRLLAYACSFYERFAEENAGDPDLQRDVGTAHFRLGHAQWSLGHPNESIEEYKKAKEILEAQMDESQAITGPRAELADTYFGMGKSYSMIGNLPEACRWFDNARQHWSHLANDQSEDWRFFLNKADAYTEEGSIRLRLDENERALQCFQNAAEILESYRDRIIDPLLRKRGLLPVLFGAVYALERLGRSEEAARWRMKEQVNRYELALHHENSDDDLIALAINHREFGQALCQKGDLEAGISHLQEAYAVIEPIAERNPHASNLIRMIGPLETELCNALLTMGDRTTGMQLVKRSVARLQTWVSDHPDDDELRFMLGVHFIVYGDLLRQAQNHHEAVDCYEKSLAELTLATKRVPGEEDRRLVLGVCHEKLAQLLASSTDDSVRDGQTALHHAKTAVKLNDAVENLETLAAAHAETGDFEKAVSLQEQAIRKSRLDESGQSELEKRLGLYRSRQPLRED